jgi:thiosulfate/3-mercaptopyruvate sulfurtransferase
MGELGFGTEHDIVVYDDAGGTIAARMWWMLDNLGHASVRLLDGGLGAWREVGGPIATDVTEYPPAPMELARAWSRTVDRDRVAGQLGSIRLLDGRAGERYRGEVEPIDPAAGHIPTALSAPTNANLGPDGRFLPAEQLRARLEDFAADEGEGEVVSYCGSGTTACHNVLAARLAGLPDPLLYVGSFSDWSTAGMPVATGAEPGEPVPR